MSIHTQSIIKSSSLEPALPLTQNNQNHAVASQEHLADKAVLVDGAAQLALGIARRLGPHLLDVLQHHVAMPVKGLDAGEQLAVVAA